MPLRLHVLGNRSAFPSAHQITSAQILTSDKSYFLIDCGEATQMKLAEAKIKRNQIKAIFISHLHGDHVYGLPGLIGSFNHFNRREKLTLIGPIGIKEFLESIFTLSHSHFNFEMDIKEFDPSVSHVVYETRQITVTSVPLDHRIPTQGYVFRESEKELNIKAEIFKKYELKREDILDLKSGSPVLLENGYTLQPEEACFVKFPPKSYAYISDTRYDEKIVDYIKNVDLLYHESTYDRSLKKQAEERGHSTAEEAARIALKADVGGLLLGHFSGRYKNTDALIEEAQKIFSHTKASHPGMVIDI